jgi:hypothetical protein
MEDLNEIKEKLNVLYKEYQEKNNYLNKVENEEVRQQLVKMTSNSASNPSMIAYELSRFSADICKDYFNLWLKNSKPQIGLIDEIIAGLLATDRDASKSQFYVRKFVYVTTTLIRNYAEKALYSVQLAKLVAFIARFAVKSDKYKAEFNKLVIDSSGKIYLLDYFQVSKLALNNIWNVTNNLYPDLSSSEYKEYIINWSKKNIYINKSEKDELTIKYANEKRKDKKFISNNEPLQKTDESKISLVSSNKVKTIESVLKKENFKEKTIKEEKEVESSNSEYVTKEFVTLMANKLYENIQKEFSNEKKIIITTIEEAISPLSNAVGSFQTEINKNHNLSDTNSRLTTRIKESEQCIQDLEKNTRTLESENDYLRNKVTELETQKAEIDEKLKEAYSINSRESSLEAERIRTDLTKSFVFLYEDWLDYEFTDVSEGNYESLQAIIKKVFRTLERNGIDFKGNNK